MARSSPTGDYPNNGRAATLQQNPPFWALYLQRRRRKRLAAANATTGGSIETADGHPITTADDQPIEAI